jgi:hypothetical protein
VELDCDNPKRLQFSPDAQQLFYGWLADLEAKLRGDKLPSALTCHLSKYRSLMPSLALLFELADWAAERGGGESVSLDHTIQAAEFCEYLESHAYRLYSCIISPEVKAAGELAEKIKHKEVGKVDEKSRLVVLSAREIYQKQWSGLDTPDRACAALDILQDAGWLRQDRRQSGAHGGRPATRYLVNPTIF